MSLAYKRLMIAGILIVAALVFFTLWAYDVIKIDFISFMEIQPSFSAMEDPLPLPPLSVPIQGAAYLTDANGEAIPPENPIAADESSIARGAILFEYNCKICHGEAGDGKGPIGAFFIEKKPADLTSAMVQDQSDGELFLTLTNGKGYMPYMRDNLTVRDRWDVINYVRTLKNTGAPVQGGAQ